MKTNVRLATEAAAQARGVPLSQDEQDQLQHADMLIDVRKNWNSPHCQVMQVVDEIFLNYSFHSCTITLRLITTVPWSGCIQAVSWISVQLFCTLLMRV